MALDLAWVVSFPDDVAISPGGARELVLDRAGFRFSLPDISPGLKDALWRLRPPGETIGRLATVLQQARVPHGPAKVFHYLHLLAEQGFLDFSVYVGGLRLATWTPITFSFGLAREGIQDRPCLLSRFAYLHRQEGLLVLESPLSAGRIHLHDGRAAQVIHALATPGTVEELARRVPVLGETLKPFLNLLFKARLLTVADDQGRSAEDANNLLQTWEFHDLLFHTRSREGRFDGIIGENYPAKRQPPSACKTMASSEQVELSKPDMHTLEQTDPPLAGIMEKRCSIREYGDSPITVEQLGEFLFRVARVRECSKDEVETSTGPAELEIAARPYPSGGALYELEFYPVIRACANLAAGLYHYDGLNHKLTKVSAMESQVEQLLASAGMAAGIEAKDLQVLVIMAARFPRVTWKYSGLAYALILKHVGVAMQTMYLAATAMGLAPCAIGVGDSDLFAKAIGGDYYAETSVGEFLLGSKP